MDQPYLLPLDLRAWLPEGHLALFVSDVVESLDLSEILQTYRRIDRRGNLGYHPVMMVKLLVYGYCTGKPSSRKLEKATWDEVPYRVLSGNQQPDHDSIAAFRQRHLKALARLFVQVLKMCQQAGLVKLGHVAVDGTKMKANASKHKATTLGSPRRGMSYDRMVKTEEALAKEAEALLKEAERIDAEEDALYGKGKRGDELPDELKRRESRLKKIREAKAALEAEAKAQAQAKADEVSRRIEERERQEAETGKKMGGKPPAVPDPENTVPEPKAQRNFTDPESRIMLDGATKSFQQAYNTQLAVDETAQIIVGTAVTDEANDKRQLVPVLMAVKENLGRLAENSSADNGYFSVESITNPELAGTSLYISVGREGKEEPLTESPAQEQATPAREAPTQGSPPAGTSNGGATEVGNGVGETSLPSVKKQMRDKLKTAAGKAIYKMRKAIVEPVFGQIKHVRGFRQFSFRGLAKVTAEWDLVALTHNLLKLFRSGWNPKGTGYSQVVDFQ